MRARILPPTAENISLVAEALREGAVAAIPTETVYGLAGAALQPEALTRIFEAKERPTFDPLIVHVSLSAKGLWPLSRLGLIDLPLLSEAARDRAEQLIQKFWPGPLTLVLPKNKDTVPDLATSGLETVALRMPAHPVAQALLAAAGTPLAAPSANRFGRISPTSAEDVANELGDRIDYILDGGRSQIGLESTIVEIGAQGELTMLRPGGISIEELAAATQTVPQSPMHAGNAERRTGDRAEAGAMPAPGMLESHYAPTKSLGLLKGSVLDHDFFEEVRSGSKVGLLIFSGDAAQARRHFASITGCEVVECRVLSPSGDLREAAHRLFSELRALDSSKAEVLFAEPCPSSEGLGFAIADRLRRASARRS